MIVRVMETDDVKAVSEIEAISIRRPWSYDSLMDACNDPNALYIVACEDSQGLGYVGMWVSFEDAEITSVAVHPDFRRKGVAKRLLEEGALLAAKRGVEKLFLEVRVSNTAAKNLYEKNGFKSLALRPGIYENPVEDGLLMMRRITEG